MEAGRLRHRVTIQRAVEVQDSYGEVDRTWMTLAVLWASVEPLTGQEYLVAQTEGAEVTTRITIRYYSGVQPTDQVVWGTRTYDVRAVLADPRNAVQMVLMCRERVD